MFSKDPLILSKMSNGTIARENLPIKIIITFKKEKVILQYFLPEGSGDYPYVHVKETWFNDGDKNKNSRDTQLRLDVLRGYLNSGYIEIEIETDQRYAYAEFEKGHRKRRIYAYTIHEGETT